MSKKMSYASAIDAVLNGAPIEGEVRETLERCRESHMKRNTRKVGPTKTQIANAEIGEAVIAAMDKGTQYTIADVKGLVPAIADATPQKVGPICRNLVKAGRLSTDKVKGKVVYFLAE